MSEGHMESVRGAFDLTGRVTIITGGAGLLGVKHAEAIAEMGGIPVLLDLDGEKARARAREIASTFGVEALGLTTDVTQPRAIADALSKTLGAFGRVDILINNAAIDPKVKNDGSLLETSRFEHFPLEDWNFQISVGLTGAYLCAQVFGSRMAANGGGVILNIASDLSVIAPDQRLYRREGLSEDQQPVKPVTYSVIKTGLIGLTRYLAVYWADKGVRVNALSPGGVYTGQPEAFVSRLVSLIPLGRMAQHDEYRGAIQFLCSDSSMYMTGQNIVMDGGRSVW